MEIKYFTRRHLYLLVVISILLSRCSATLTMEDVQEASTKKDISTLVSALSAKDMNVRKEAASSLLKIGRSTKQSLINILEKETNTWSCGYATIILGEIEAYDAIPIIINTFPSLEETEIVEIDGQDLSIGGGIVDYQVVSRKLIDVLDWVPIEKRIFPESNLIMYMDYNDIPQIQVLKEQYGKYLDHVHVQKYHAEYYLPSYSKTDIIENFHIKYIVQAAAYSLNKLTGQDFGNDQAKWRAWWEEKEAISVGNDSKKEKESSILNNMEKLDSNVSKDNNLLLKIKVIPNPLILREDSQDVEFTFDNINNGGVIRIFNIRGYLIKEAKTDDSFWVWDGIDKQGNKIGNGVYIYHIQDGEGKEHHGKFALIKD